jgi:uncharacterized membrane protein YgcG
MLFARKNKNATSKKAAANAHARVGALVAVSRALAEYRARARLPNGPLYEVVVRARDARGRVRTVGISYAEELGKWVAFYDGKLRAVGDPMQFVREYVRAPTGRAIVGVALEYDGRPLPARRNGSSASGRSPARRSGGSGGSGSGGRSGRSKRKSG